MNQRRRVIAGLSSQNATVATPHSNQVRDEQSEGTNLTKSEIILKQKVKHQGTSVSLPQNNRLYTEIDSASATQYSYIGFAKDKVARKQQKQQKLIKSQNKLPAKVSAASGTAGSSQADVTEFDLAMLQQKKAFEKEIQVL